MMNTIEAKPTVKTDRAQKVALLESTTIRLPIMSETHQFFDEMREDFVACPGETAMMLRILGPSGAGKSKILKSYLSREMERTGLALHQIRVVYVELDEVTSMNQFYRLILMALGATGVSLSGDLHILKQRSLKYLRELGIELILIDEGHHLWNKAGAKTIWNKTEALKSAANAGFPPMVFAGIADAEQKFSSNPQLSMRQHPPIDINPFKVANPDDCKSYGGFCGFLDKSMVDKGIVAERIGLLDKYFVEMFQASGGLVGVTFKIVLHALRRALRQERNTIGRDDLSYAVETWAMKEGFTSSNPFARPQKDK